MSNVESCLLTVPAAVSVLVFFVVVFAKCEM